MLTAKKTIDPQESSRLDSFAAAIIKLRLKQLFEGDPAVYKELVKLCNNTDYVLSDNVIEVMEYYNLCDNGRVIDLVKEIVRKI